MGNKASTMDVMSINMENIRGKIVGLSPREVMWKPEFGDGISFNRMTGSISARVGNDISEYEAKCVINGLRAGRLIVLEEEIKGEPMKPINASIMSDELVIARRLLDEQEPLEFEKSIERQPMRIAEACLELEKLEGNRPKFVDIIKNRLRLD